MATKTLFVVAVGVLLAVNVDGKINGRKLRYGEPCDTPGFFGDAEDCMKFYRCAEHDTGVEGRPLLAKFTFQCPVGTAFDEDLSTCNFPHSLMNVPPNCPTEIPTASPPAEEVVAGENSSIPTTASPATESSTSETIIGTNGRTNNVITFKTIATPIHPIFVPQFPIFTPYSNVIYLKK